LKGIDSQISSYDNGTSGRIETMYKTSNVPSMWEMLKKAIPISIDTARKFAKAYSKSTIMGLAKIVLDAWTSLGESCLQMICQKHYDIKHPKEISIHKVFMEAAKIWPQVTYFTSNFLSGKQRIASKQIYLPRLSLVYARPIFETTFHESELFMYEEAKVETTDLDSILDRVYNEIDPNFKKLTIEVNSKVFGIMENFQTRIDAYCDKIYKSYKNKSDLQLPGICSVCYKIFRNALSFSCCCINARFSNCRSKTYINYRIR
jgi:hypothetical protein